MTKRRRSHGEGSNCVPGCSVILCPARPEELYADDKLYKYKIKHDEDKLSFLSCHVLFNNICAFVVDIQALEARYGANSLTNFSYVVDFEEEDVKGKKKKTALRMKAGQPLCKIVSNTGESVFCHIPINCQLLEINSELSSQPDLFWKSSYQRQYVAIGYPTFTLPDLEVVKSLIQKKYTSTQPSEVSTDASVPVVDSSSSSMATRVEREIETDSLDRIPCSALDCFSNVKVSNLCFEFAKSGTCKHGDTCKFVHG